MAGLGKNKAFFDSFKILLFFLGYLFTCKPHFDSYRKFKRDLEAEVSPRSKSSKTFISPMLSPPKVDGKSLISANLIVVATKIGKNSVAEVHVEKDRRADYIEYFFCLKNLPESCENAQKNPYSMVVSPQQFPHAKSGLNLVSARSCVRENHARDTSQLCGDWLSIEYEQKPFEDESSLQLAEEKFGYEEDIKKECDTIEAKLKFHSQDKTAAHTEVNANFKQLLANHESLGQDVRCALIQTQAFDETVGSKEENWPYILMALGSSSFLAGSLIFGAGVYLDKSAPRGELKIDESLADDLVLRPLPEPLVRPERQEVANVEQIARTISLEPHRDFLAEWLAIERSLPAIDLKEFEVTQEIETRKSLEAKRLAVEAKLRQLANQVTATDPEIGRLKASSAEIEIEIKKLEHLEDQAHRQVVEMRTKISEKDLEITRIIGENIQLQVDIDDINRQLASNELPSHFTKQQNLEELEKVSKEFDSTLESIKKEIYRTIFDNPKLKPKGAAFNSSNHQARKKIRDWLVDIIAAKAIELSEPQIKLGANHQPSFEIRFKQLNLGPSYKGAFSSEAVLLSSENSTIKDGFRKLSELKQKKDLHLQRQELLERNEDLESRAQDKIKELKQKISENNKKNATLSDEIKKLEKAGEALNLKHEKFKQQLKILMDQKLAIEVQIREKKSSGDTEYRKQNEELLMQRQELKEKIAAKKKEINAKRWRRLAIQTQALERNEKIKTLAQALTELDKSKKKLEWEKRVAAESERLVQIQAEHGRALAEAEENYQKRLADYHQRELEIAEIKKENLRIEEKLRNAPPPLEDPRPEGEHRGKILTGGALMFLGSVLLTSSGLAFHLSAEHDQQSEFMAELARIGGRIESIKKKILALELEMAASAQE